MPSSSSSRSWPLLPIRKLQKLTLFFATGAGTGYLPGLPGTAGTFLAIPLSLLLNRIALVSLFVSLVVLVSFIVTAGWLCKRGEEIFQEKDSQKIVIDEIAGFLLANYLSPAGLVPTGMAFFLFRFFDIMKPFPASRAAKIEGGLGVLLDDMVAALYTFLILRLLSHWSLL